MPLMGAANYSMMGMPGMLPQHGSPEQLHASQYGIPMASKGGSPKGYRGSPGMYEDRKVEDHS